MNICIFKGNITRDLELKYTPTGKPVLDLGLAVNKVWYDQAGQKQERTTFVDVRFWGRTAETVAKHFSKGRPILIQGELAQEEWEDKKTGEKRRKSLIIADTFEFCGEVRGHGGAVPASRLPSKAGEGGEPVTEGLDDEIPF